MRIVLAIIIASALAAAAAHGNGYTWRNRAVAKQIAAGQVKRQGGSVSAATPPSTVLTCTLPAVLPCTL